VTTSSSATLRLRHALALGLLQGPTELLPVSSSAHTTLIPTLLGWPYAELDGELRKSFEVALHAGASAALVLDMRRELLDAASRLDRHRAAVVAFSLAPAALAGLALRGLIARRLGGPRAIAAGLGCGSVAMSIAELAFAPGEREETEARAADGLALGLAQAVALAPGVSRYGATLAVARARGFSRVGSQTLSWHAALPVMLGASALEAIRVIRRPPAPGAGLALSAGAAAALVSTSLSARVLRRPGRALRSLLPSALYRVLLAAFVLVRTPHERPAGVDRVR
jgi:undecaprenyl-diphosphatase